MKSDYIQVNGIRMHVKTAGKGPLVVLLHGFPQFWYTWRKQIPALAEHFTVVAPDLRGYGETERPPHVEDYKPSILAADVAGLIQAMGYEKAHIVGHDWGGGVAWRIATQFPQVVDRLVVINCPHSHIFQKALRSNFTQMKKSWYIFFFQLPYLPELLFKLNSKRIIHKLFRGSAASKETFSDEDLLKYQEAMEKPGAFTAALNYYRAAFRQSPQKGTHKPHDQKISAPTLLIWGENDIALGKELTYGMEPLFSGPFQIEYIPNCSHWVPEEQPELLNHLLLNFLSKSL